MDIRLWLTLIVLNFLNGFMLYYIVYNVVTPRKRYLFSENTINKPKITPKLLFIGFGYGVGVGTAFYFIGDNQLAEFIFNTSSVIVFIMLIKFFAKEKILNSSLAYAIAFSAGAVIQFPMIAATIMLDQPLNICITLISQIIVLILTICFYKYLPLHGIFLFIKMSATLVNITFVFAIAFSLFFYMFHDFISSRWINPLMGSIGMIAFYLTTKYTIKLRERAHDVGNLLEGLNFLLRTEGNLEEAKKHYAKMLTEIGLNIPEKKPFEPGKYEKNLLTFIENKKQKYQSKAEIIANIKYYATHEEVSIPTMVQMLGTLLDNAFDTKTKKPIFIDMTVAGGYLEITVANASDRKTMMEIDLMFGKKYSTKKGDHGYGLPKLLKSVKSYGGKMNAHCDYQAEHKSYYLTISIKIAVK